MSGKPIWAIVDGAGFSLYHFHDEAEAKSAARTWDRTCLGGPRRVVRYDPFDARARKAAEGAAPWTPKVGDVVHPLVDSTLMRVVTAVHGGGVIGVYITESRSHWSPVRADHYAYLRPATPDELRAAGLSADIPASSREATLREAFFVEMAKRHSAFHDPLGDAARAYLDSRGAK